MCRYRTAINLVGNLTLQKPIARVRHGVRVCQTLGCPRARKTEHQQSKYSAVRNKAVGRTVQYRTAVIRVGGVGWRDAVLRHALHGPLVDMAMQRALATDSIRPNTVFTSVFAGAQVNFRHRATCWRSGARARVAHLLAAEYPL